MRIKYLNPRYDTTFKMLLENDEFARELISIIIGREIIELQAAPQVKTEFLIDILKLVVYRKDYRAKIQTTDAKGNKKIETVKIEMQKSSISPHIDRFREYIGTEYAKPDTIKIDKETGDQIKTYLPIISIFFIEKTFNKYLPAVLGIGKNYFNVLTGRKYTGKPDKYVELLTHEAYFIQLDKLPKELKEKFKILELFMGEIVGDTDLYMEIEIDKKTYLNSIMGRALFSLANKISDKQTILNVKAERKMIQTVNSNYYQKRKILEQQIRIEQNEQKIEQNEQKIEQKMKQDEQTIIDLAKILKENGIAIELIQEKTGLTKQQIKNS